MILLMLNIVRDCIPLVGYTQQFYFPYVMNFNILQLQLLLLLLLLFD